MKRRIIMICDKIVFDNETIITVYHKGFSDEEHTKPRMISETIQDKQITFMEHYEPFDNHFNNQVCSEEGLLDTKSKYNVYKGASICAKYKRFAGGLPCSIFDSTEDTLKLKLSLEHLDKIFEFIKKYTNLDVAQDITLFGDNLLFEPRELIINSENECKIISFENLETDMIIAVNFCNSKATVLTSVVETISDLGKFKIEAPEDWSYMDISVYKNGELYYKNPCFSFIRNVLLNMSMLSKKNVKLNKFGLEETITTSYTEEIRVGNDTSYKKSNNDRLQNIQKQINIYYENKRILFFKPNEEKIALKELSNIFSNAKDELWIIDSYFSYNNKIGYPRDILKLIIESSAKSKYVVFFSNDESEIEKLDKSLLNDEEINRILTYKKLNISFKQTNMDIHDRFIISKSLDSVSVCVIGTSFNSLVNNYYCLIKLGDADSRLIYDNLKNLIMDDNFCKTKVY